MQALRTSKGVAVASLAEQLTLRDLLLGISRELTSNATLAHECQDVIAEIAPLGLSNSVIERMQGVDLFSQILIELAEVVKRTAESCPVELVTPDDILLGVRLASLRDRLAGRSSESAVSDDAELW